MLDLEAELDFLNDPSGREAAKRNAKPPRPRTPTAEEELMELRKHPHTYIRRNVRSQVDDGIWLANLQSFYTYLDDRSRFRKDTMNRCVICTLPLGTCDHAEEWAVDPIELSVDLPLREAMVDEDTRDATTKELDDVLGLIGDGVQVETVQQTEDVDIRELRWTHMLPRLSDKIGDKYVALSVPPERGWHAAVTVGKFVLVHGGLRYKGNEAPQPFVGAATYDDVEYLSDLYVYDILQQSWHTPDPQPSPVGRYGHVMSALDDRRVIMYGGRGQRGRFLDDTWVFDIIDNAWTPVSVDQSCPPPSPRVFSSAVSVPGAVTVHFNLNAPNYLDVLLFGGTDGAENFGDLWIFRSHPEDMRWERAVGVGLPPSPRYGHSFVMVSERSVAVAGGCAVAPQSEVGAVNGVTLQESKALQEMCSLLERCYQAEGASLGLGGRSLALELESATRQGKLAPGVAGEELKRILRQAAGLAATMHRLEQKTRDAENAVVAAFFDQKSLKQMRSHRAKHPNKNMDIMFLDFRDLTWKEQIYPPFSGQLPPARMHFAAVTIGPYFLVSGGTAPTAMGHVPIDQPYSRVYALDMKTMKWTLAPPMETTEYLEGPLRAAEGDIKRAQKQVEASKNRGMSLGAKRGVTIDYLQAEKVLEVCKWRKRMLIRERDEFRQPPSSRWGVTITRLDQRAIFLGGWDSKRTVKRGDIYTLDLEQDLERRRRMEAEFQAKLEGERGIQEKHALQLEIQSAYELRAIIAAERALEAREREQMAVEEVRSAMPPLSVPKQVELVKANDRSMWLSWERVFRDADNYELKDPGSVVYFLYAKGGFKMLYDGDRVIVKCFQSTIQPQIEEDNKKKKKNTFGSDSDSSTDSSTDSSDDETSVAPSSPNSPLPLPPVRGMLNGAMKDPTLDPSLVIPPDSKVVDAWGEIIRGYTEGTFDIAFDDGSIEKRVDRARLRLETSMEPAPFQASHAVQVKSALRKKMRDRGKFKRDPEELAAEEELRLEEEERLAAEHAATEAAKAAERQKLLGDVDATMARIKEAAQRRAERQAKQLEEEEGAKVKPTVNPGPEWRLLYVGKDTEYACTGITPDDVLYREPHRVVPMTFAVQTEGQDFPPGERSQLSKPVTFWTTHNEQNKSKVNVTAGLSRAKKEVVKAIIADKEIAVERISNYVYTHGAADHYV